MASELKGKAIAILAADDLPAFCARIVERFAARA
jgi:hypothetical protein